MFDTDLPPDLYPIRLQGPWQYAASPEAAQRTIRLPFGDDLPPEGKSARLTRNFQQPTNLDREERVLLVLPPRAEPRAVTLAGESLPAPKWLGERLVWDLTDRLQRSNQLGLEFTDGDWGEALREPVLLGIMPDADGSWWESLPAAKDRVG